MSGAWSVRRQYDSLAVRAASSRAAGGIKACVDGQCPSTLFPPLLLDSHLFSPLRSSLDAQRTLHDVPGTSLLVGGSAGVHVCAAARAWHRPRRRELRRGAAHLRRYGRRRTRRVQVSGMRCAAVTLLMTVFMQAPGKENAKDEQTTCISRDRYVQYMCIDDADAHALPVAAQPSSPRAHRRRRRTASAQQGGM